MGRLYVVGVSGGPWPKNTYVEEGGDGMVQAVYHRDDGTGRLEVGGYKGLMLPMSSVRPYLIRIQKGGLDEYVYSGSR